MGGSKRQPSKTAEDLMLPREIILGIIEGLHGAIEADRIQRKIDSASDWIEKYDRTNEFQTLYDYIKFGLKQLTHVEKPKYAPPDPELSREETGQKVLHVQNAPGYLQCAIRRIGVEFNWLATLTLVDYDRTAELFEDLPPQLGPELMRMFMKLCHLEKFQVRKGIIRQRKKVNGEEVVKHIHFLKVEINGIDVHEDLKSYAEDFAKGKEFLEAGDIRQAKIAFRSSGMTLVVLAQREAPPPKPPKPPKEGSSSESSEESEESEASETEPVPTLERLPSKSVTERHHNRRKNSKDKWKGAVADIKAAGSRSSSKQRGSSKHSHHSHSSRGHSKPRSGSKGLTGSKRGSIG